MNPRSGVVRRHHLYEQTIQRAVKRAVLAATLTKRASCHTAPASADLSPMVRISFLPAAAEAERFAPYGVRKAHPDQCATRSATCGQHVAQLAAPQLKPHKGQSTEDRSAFPTGMVGRRIDNTRTALRAKEHTCARIAEAGSMNHPVVSRDQWIAERKSLLAREKELTRLSDQVARERRALPWVRLKGAQPEPAETS